MADDVWRERACDAFHDAFPSTTAFMGMMSKNGNIEQAVIVLFFLQGLSEWV